ncbi:MAG: response regulator transcription factor [Rhodocyclales bacterium]|nr:response regulator transcription factor [Rhodocyclales bacterium]
MQGKSNPDACVFVVEDDPVMSLLYRELLESIGVTARLFGSGEEFFAAFSPSWQGGMLLDLRMPGMNGLEVLRQLRERDCHLPVIVVSSFGDVRSTVQALKLGAVDFLEKPFANSEFIDAVQAMLVQGRQLSAAQAVRQEIQACLATLSAREREVTELIARGLTSREIAALLAISSRTVDVHRANILDKLNCSSSVELAALLARIPAVAR